ncbi:MAG: trimethylamine methyltransferase family protein [Deltaproteobacteria bacterium]|jgi:trimethylamine--corrinoid protein Co-methyltransferase|nr:trimethylamine methyltransferase family protein [Deltaproteobacteria bacterium]
MQLKGLAGGLYKPLSADDIATIHEASLTILENIGMTYESGLDATLDLLQSQGAKLDKDRSRVFFARDLVMTQADLAPKQVVLYSRDGKNDLDLTQHRVYLGTGGAAVKILDLETGEARSTTINDLYQLARLTDKLENIHFFVRPCIPTDIPVTEYDANAVFAGLKGTAKHFMTGATNEEGLHKVLDIAATVAGGLNYLKAEPFISMIASFAISPLKLCTQSTLIMQEAVRNRIPVALSAAPMAGSTSPVTMAGTLAQLHAEQLAGITICQLTGPGAPILYGGIPGRANLRSLAYSGGAVECGMMNAAIHQLAHHIKVPNYNSSGLSDSKIPDAQASWEKALTTVLAAMAGSNYVHHAAGMLESMLTVAYEQFVIDDEIIGMSCKVLEGIPVDDEHLALEAIDEVGPGGSFITSSHTMTHMRQEYFSGNGVTDQDSREKWIAKGSQDTRTRAREIAKKILAAEEQSYIPANVEKAIRGKYDILL